MALKFAHIAGGALLAAMVMVWAAAPASAETLFEDFVGLYNNHNRVKAAEADLDAAEENIKVALGGWYPELEITALKGQERQLKPDAADTSLPTRKLDLKVTQLLWDFGSTNSSIRQARMTYERAKAVLDSTRQDLLVEAVTAYFGVTDANEILQFAKESEENIKRHTELENARVERGSGFTIDVLQAKAQLAGAQATRVQSQGALRTALNRYRALFGHDPADITGMVEPRIPFDLLPETEDEAVEMAMQSNPQLLATKITVEIAGENIDKVKADEFYPILNGIAEQKFKEDFDGTPGSKNERLFKVEMTYSFNLGATSFNTLSVSKLSYRALQDRYLDARDLVEEKVRNAWQDIVIKKELAEFLFNQANIAAEFVELARKERQLGKRSLLDVLDGETDVIDAQSDATSAETAVAVAVFTLLGVMGRLEPSNIQ